VVDSDINRNDTKIHLGSLGLVLSRSSQTDESVLVNRDFDEAAKVASENWTFTLDAIKTLSRIILLESTPPSKIDLVNLVSRELNLRKLDSEFLINQMISNNWLEYYNFRL
jgi:hypothetical protein